MAWYHRKSDEPAPEAKGLAFPDAMDFATFGIIGSASGVAVTAETAMRCTAVRQAVSLIGGSIASLPIRFIRRGPGGAMTELDGQYRAAAVMARPNGWTGRTRLWRDVIADAILGGNGFVLATRVRGEVRELHRLPPHAVGVEQVGATAEPVYRVSLAEGSRIYLARDVIHLRDLPTPDGARGAGLVQHAREAIGLALVMEQHAAGLFGSGARPAGALKFAKSLTPAVLERLKASFASSYAGGSNSGRTLLLEEGVSWEALAMKSVDAQFLELRNFAVSEIARAANLSPILLGETSKATFSNAEQSAQNLLSFTLTPWIEQIEDELERVLLPADDVGRVSIEVDYSAFAVADLEKRTAAAAKRIEVGLGSIDEERAAIMRGPVPGGDAFMTSVQSRPLGTPATTPAE
jgi:HK97 family phage portal protein